MQNNRTTKPVPASPAAPLDADRKATLIAFLTDSLIAEAKGPGRADVLIHLSKCLDDVRSR